MHAVFGKEMKSRPQVAGLSHDTASLFPVSFCSKLPRLITPQRRNVRIKGGFALYQFVVLFLEKFV